MIIMRKCDDGHQTLTVDLYGAYSIVSLVYVLSSCNSSVVVHEEVIMAAVNWTRSQA